MTNNAHTPTRLNLVATADQGAIKRFLSGQPQVIQAPPALFDEINKTTPLEYSHPAEPMSQVYQNATGYSFNWGHILCRRSGQYDYWDYCLTALLASYLQKGFRLIDLQRVAFYTLDRLVSQTATDLYELMNLHQGWLFYPGQGFSTFTQVIYSGEEPVARTWTAKTILERHINLIIEEAEYYVSLY